MKKWMMPIGLFCFGINAVHAQAGTKKKAHVASANKETSTAKIDTSATSFSLTSSSSNQAFATAPTYDLYIADPTLRVFNNRSITGAKPDNERAIIGIPKLRTGVSNSHIIFYPTVSSTSGTSTGSGVVGTGTSLGNMGTNASGMGGNGRNPYAGPGIYGTRVMSDLRPTSTIAPPVSSQKD